MSLVMAMQFGDRICVLSDTMVSDHSATNDDVIPGQLKTIVVNKQLTIAYSGSVNKAIFKIREIRTEIDKGVLLETILESLSKFTLDESGDVDFIVASHISTPILYKIANGRINSGFDRYWIGNGEAATLVQQEIDRDNREVEQSHGYSTPEEDKFKDAFKKVVYAREMLQVGGFTFDCLCSPYGHCYVNHAMAHGWDTIIFDDTYDEMAQRAYEKTGTEFYSFSLVSASERGLAVTGAFLDQNNIGYLYSPLNPDLDSEIERKLGKPKKYGPISLEQLNQEVQNYACRLSCV